MRIKNLPSIESMDGSQDALVIEQTDGSEDKSRKVSPSQLKQYILNDMDEVPTQDSDDPVKSGGVFSTIDDVYSVMGQMGAKNLIIYPYYDPSGRTNRGITYTYDKDGIITANGSTDANNQSYMTMDDFSRGLVLPSTKKYTLTCEKTNDNNKGFAVLYFKNADNTAKTVSVHVVYEDGTTRDANSDYVSLLYNNVAHTSATFWVDTDTIYITQARIHTNSGTITNAVLKPMLRLAEDTDNTYQPYAKTNRQLTEEIGDLSQTGLTGDSVAEQLTTVNTAIGERAIRVKANTSNTKQFTFPRSIWADNGMTGSNSHTALFSGGYNNRISAGLVATNGTGVSVIKLGDNNVTATISGNNIELAFNDTVYTDLYLILLN